jgi:hypothetical protein
MVNLCRELHTSFGFVLSEECGRSCHDIAEILVKLAKGPHFVVIQHKT